MPNSPMTPPRGVYSPSTSRVRQVRRGTPPRRSPVSRQPMFNNRNNNKNKAAVKIQAALRGWLARQKHLPKNKFRSVINPNGTVSIAVFTRLGASAADRIAKRKQHERYMNRLRGM